MRYSPAAAEEAAPVGAAMQIGVNALVGLLGAGLLILPQRLRGPLVAGIECLLDARGLDAFAGKLRLLQGASHQFAVALVIVDDQDAQRGVGQGPNGFCHGNSTMRQ